MTTLDAADTLPAIVGLPGYLAAMRTALGTGLLALSEIAALDV